MSPSEIVGPLRSHCCQYFHEILDEVLLFARQINADYIQDKHM